MAVSSNVAGSVPGRRLAADAGRAALAAAGFRRTAILRGQLDRPGRHIDVLIYTRG